MNYQKMIVVGNATADARLFSDKTKKLISTATFRVGVSDAKEETTFFPVVVFGKLAEAVAKFISKGTLVLVEGRLEVNRIGGFDIVADRVVLGPSAKPQA